jgi:hypothetical protein
MRGGVELVRLGELHAVLIPAASYGTAAKANALDEPAGTLAVAILMGGLMGTTSDYGKPQ